MMKKCYKFDRGTKNGKRREKGSEGGGDVQGEGISLVIKVTRKISNSPLRKYVQNTIVFLHFCTFR